MKKTSSSSTASSVKCCHSKSKLEQMLGEQSIILEGPERIHVSAITKKIGGTFDEYWSSYEDVSTLYHPLRRGLRVSNNGPCLGFRPSPESSYQWLSYELVLARSVNFGRGLRHLGLKKKDYVGIYCKNRVEWVLTEQALFPFSMISVPLFDTLGPTAVNFEITQAEISTVIVEDDKKVKDVLNLKPACLSTIIHIEPLSTDTKTKAAGLGVSLYEFEEVERFGEEHEMEYPEEPPGPDDTAILNYTSGTTGSPRGALIAHKNMVAAACSSLITFALTRQELGPSDVIISYLPLAHSYEKLVENCGLIAGCSIGFFGGDIQKIMNDVKLLRPTVFPSVPRLLNRVYDKVMTKANRSPLKRFMLHTALNSKSRKLKDGVFRKNSFWDVLVFRKVQKAFGGRVHTVISGGAPAGAEVMEFFRCALGCTAFEGYGQTETCGHGTISHPQEITGGHVGSPTVCVQIKLTDVPEMKYFSKNDEGEICMRGPHVVKHYFKSPEEVENVQDEGNWIHTGDIGKWLPNGVLKIIDRKKNIFKLSQGEYVVPEKIETVYTRSQYVSQIFVYGASTESFLVAIVVPELEAFKNSHPTLRIQDICADPKIKTLILEDMSATAREYSLLSFEQVKNIYLHPKPFSVEQGLVTPTYKMKRSDLKTFFNKQIAQMYDETNSKLK